MLIQRFITIVLALTLSIQGWALNPEGKKLVAWETKANNIAQRDATQFYIEHFEIPVRLLNMNVADYLPKEILASLIFKKNGEDYMRWLINPEDTKWYKEVTTFLKENTVDPTPQKYFKAHYTASRSFIIEDPETGVFFSSKVSTNNTGGNWKDKQQDAKDTNDVRVVSDYAQKVASRIEFENFKLLYEPFAATINSIDQGMLVRLLADVSTGEKVYLPAFSALHEETGVRIAKANGSDDPAEFWKENYIKPLGRAIAEFGAHFGMFYDSPHSQNFLIEMDKNLKPTGKIILRDFGDSYLMKGFFDRAGRQDMLESWGQEHNVYTTHAGVWIGPLHGNKFPSWMNKSKYKEWINAFSETFDEYFSEYTGIPRAELEKVEVEVNGMYGGKKYSIQTQSWKRYFDIAAQNFSGKGKPLHMRELLKQAGLQNDSDAQKVISLPKKTKDSDNSKKPGVQQDKCAQLFAS